MGFRLIHQDAVQAMQQLIDEGVKVDAIITDPPYKSISGGSGVGKKGNRPRGLLEKNDGTFFKHNDIEFKEWVPMCYELLADNSHAYFMTNFLNLSEFMNVIEMSGFKIHNLLVWEKNNAAPNRWYMKNCEYIIFARKGKAKSINSCGSKTVHHFSNYLSGTKLHPSQKPVDLMKLYVNNSTKPGDIVLDPFMGSGSTGVACKNLGRDFIGIELDENYFNIATSRLSERKGVTCAELGMI